MATEENSSMEEEYNNLTEVGKRFFSAAVDMAKQDLLQGLAGEYDRLTEGGKAVLSDAPVTDVIKKNTLQGLSSLRQDLDIPAEDQMDLIQASLGEDGNSATFGVNLVGHGDPIEIGSLSVTENKIEIEQNYANGEKLRGVIEGSKNIDRQFAQNVEKVFQDGGMPKEEAKYAMELTKDPVPKGRAAGTMAKEDVSKEGKEATEKAAAPDHKSLGGLLQQRKDVKAQMKVTRQEIDDLSRQIVRLDAGIRAMNRGKPDATQETIQGVDQDTRNVDAEQAGIAEDTKEWIATRDHLRREWTEKNNDIAIMHASIPKAGEYVQAVADRAKQAAGNTMHSVQNGAKAVGGGIKDAAVEAKQQTVSFAHHMKGLLNKGINAGYNALVNIRDTMQVTFDQAPRMTSHELHKATTRASLEVSQIGRNFRAVAYSVDKGMQGLNDKVKDAWTHHFEHKNRIMNGLRNLGRAVVNKDPIQQTPELTQQQKEFLRPYEQDSQMYGARADRHKQAFDKSIDDTIDKLKEVRDRAEGELDHMEVGKMSNSYRTKDGREIQINSMNLGTINRDMLHYSRDAKVAGKTIDNLTQAKEALGHGRLSGFRDKSGIALDMAKAAVAKEEKTAKKTKMSVDEMVR